MTTTLLSLTSGIMSNDTDEDGWRFDDNVQRRIVGTGLLIVCLVGILGNSMVIIAVSLTEKLQNVTNAFVSNLAITDLLHCVFLPFMIHDLYQPIIKVMPDPLLCAINGALTVLFLSVSVFSHALIAITRYMMITRSRRACQTIFTPCHILLLIIMVWVVSAIDPILAIAGVVPSGNNPKYGICSRDIRIKSSVILSSVRSVYTNILSVGVVLFCYTKVFIFVRRHNQNTLRRILTSSSGGSMSSRKTLEEKVELEDVVSDPQFQDLEVEGGISQGNGIALKQTGACDEDKTNVVPSDKSLQTISNPNKCLIDQNKETEDKIENEMLGQYIGETAVAPVDDDVFTSSHNMHKYPRPSNSKSCGQNPSGYKQIKVLNTKEPVGESCTTEQPSKFHNCQQRDDHTVKRVNIPTREESVCSITSCGLYTYNQSNWGSTKDKNSNYGNKNSSRSWSYKRSKDGPSKKKKEIDITKKLFIVVCVFFACTTPYVFFVSIKCLERLLPYAALLLASSSCLNPVIYGLAHPQFQQIFLFMVSCQLSRIPKPTRLLKWITKRKFTPRQNSVGNNVVPT